MRNKVIMNTTKKSTNRNSTTLEVFLLSQVSGQVFRRFIYGGVFAVVFILGGCASGLPGGSKTYCLQDGNYKKEFFSDYEYGKYDYERYTNLNISSNAMWCNVRGLHPMTLRWKRIGGEPQELTLDIPKLMEEMKQRQDKRFPVADGWPHIDLYYKDQEVTVVYAIYSAIPGKAGRKRNEYALTTIELD